MLVRTTFCALLLTLSAAASAQGDVDFSRIPGLDRPPKVQIDLTPGLIGFVKEAALAADPRSADLLAGLESVLVRVYEPESEKEQRAIADFIESETRTLERDGWLRTVFVDDEDAKVRIHVRMDGTTMQGMTIMVQSGDDEAVFVNVGGSIDPSRLGQLANQFGFGEAMGAIAQHGVQIPSQVPGARNGPAAD